MAEAATVVTSENYAEFAAQKLGLANEEAPTEAVVEDTPTEPVVEAEVESEPPAEEAKATEERKPNPKIEKRFSELTKRAKEAQAQAEATKAGKEALEAKLRDYEQKLNPKPVDDLGAEPQASQFQDAFEYAKALAEWTAEKAIQDFKRQEAEAKAAGADHVGLDDYLQKTKDGWTDVDVIITMPAVMGKLGPLGRIYVWDVIPQAAVTNNVAASQTAAGAGAVTLTAGTSAKSVVRTDGTTVIQLDCPRAIKVN